MDNHSYEYQLDDIQEVNEYYFGSIFERMKYIIHLSNDTDDSVCDCHVFKYNGKWYSLCSKVYNRYVRLKL